MTTDSLQKEERILPFLRLFRIGQKVECSAQAESTVHMLNWAIRSVKFLGVEFDQSEDEEVSVSDAAHL